MTTFAPNITEIGLKITEFVLKITCVVQNMTGIVLNTTVLFFKKMQICPRFDCINPNYYWIGPKFDLFFSEYD